jgi:hypothetical protein
MARPRIHPVPSVGDRFGRWSIIGPAEPSKRRQARWLVRCDCKNTAVVPEYDLRRADGRASTSCGCARKEISRKQALRHGDARRNELTPEFVAWLSMRRRCSDPNRKDYDRYGGRGISVCDRWNTSFENFLADVDRKPTPQHSLDRYPDNDGDYQPGNVRWATRIEQRRNQRPRKTKPT